eukprot:CAMPEP_0171243238 /NCGR_PEP_ID=MMETSP0790-20130122/46180_1 /TAXON_ID=2925 /ORGANISM="Alexandrium catenella, Strain OF101" /LENGTH=35 /DNA_ID= /DNA_START= /DNA_END= /DNA_ORIENTATION=
MLASDAAKRSSMAACHLAEAAREAMPVMTLMLGNV